MTIEQEIAVGVATALKTAYEADQPAVLTLIQAAEGGVEGFILNALKAEAANVKPPFNILAGMAEAQLAAFAQSLVAKYGPTVAYTFIDKELGYLVVDAAKV